MKPLHWTLDGHLSGLEAGRVDISSLLYYEALDVQCLAWKQMTIRYLPQYSYPCNFPFAPAIFLERWNL